MSILLVKPDGTSDAKPGDFVITGGGIFEKTATGSRFVSSLKDYIGADKTSSRRVVEDIYKTVTGVKGFEQIGVMQTVIGGKTSVPVGAKIDDNGIVTVSPGVDSAAYNPGAYVSQSSGSGLTGSKIAGYAIIGLVGLAVLDRFVGGSGK